MSTSHKRVTESYKFRNWYIPERMMPAIDRYITQGISPGTFLTAVICNNLHDALSRADDENLQNLPAFVAYFYNNAPAPCWGSPAKMKKWITDRKLSTPHGATSPRGVDE